MCRWLVYKGEPIFISDLVFQRGHSLIDQSMNPRESVETTNGDGFGIGWYAERTIPGVYRDVYPAWNDRNLRNIAEQVRSGLFMAHIRAATGTPVQRTNSHPFHYGRWLFQHNGLIPEFTRCKHAVYSLIDPKYAGFISGSTDSELLFYLTLTMGLERDVRGAFVRTIDAIEEIRSDMKIEEPLFLTAACIDGERVYGVRYVSPGGEARTLYHTTASDDVRSMLDDRAGHRGFGIIIASEPLDDDSDRWQAVPEGSLLTVGAAGLIEVEPLVEPAGGARSQAAG